MFVLPHHSLKLKHHLRTVAKQQRHCDANNHRAVCEEPLLVQNIFHCLLSVKVIIKYAAHCIFLVVNYLQ